MKTILIIMPNITVTITDTEEKCLNTVMVGIGTWADNFVTDRARIAQEEICAKLMKHCNDNNITDIKDFAGFEYEGFKWDGEAFIKKCPTRLEGTAGQGV